jgi:processing peptidase subunit alpha
MLTPAAPAGLRRIAGQCVGASRRGIHASAATSNSISSIVSALRTPEVPTPLTEPLGIPSASSAELPSQLPDPVITTLPNGVQVATQETFQKASSIGIFVDVGSRHEGGGFSGATHMLEKMAFQSCQAFSKTRITYEIEMMGANVVANRSRESMIFGGDVLRELGGDLTTLLLECLTRPKFAESELAEQKHAVVNYELKQLDDDATNQIFESFHSAAYGDATLGLPMYGNQLTLAEITPDTLHDFIDQHYTGERVVLAGASVDHDEMVKLATEYLGDLPGGVGGKNQGGEAVYVGGETSIMDVTAPLTHIALGFKAVGYNHDDMLYYHALHMMLGGGASFSAGGPGKGLYSRLYSNVLNQYPWVQNATAFNVQYEDCGFFGILGASFGPDVDNLTSVVCRELEAPATVLASDTELGRVKEMLKSSMLMNLESRAIVMEDLGRQVLANNKHVSASELCKKVDAMTAGDIQRVARDMLNTELTVVAHGDTKKMPKLNVLQGHFGAIRKELNR